MWNTAPSPMLVNRTTKGQPQHSGAINHSRAATDTVMIRPTSVAPRDRTCPALSILIACRPTSSARATQPNTMPAARARGTGSRTSTESRISSKPMGIRMMVLIKAAATMMIKIINTMASASSTRAIRKVSNPSAKLCSGMVAIQSVTRRVGRGQMMTISVPRAIKIRPKKPAASTRPIKRANCCAGVSTRI